jgi:hypothetical protein
MRTHFLNLATALYPENSSDGLAICGMNWGGDPDPDFQWTRDVVGDSFFSDPRSNDYPYQRRLLRWFERLGHPLATTEDRAGAFERSIIQTNWIPNQSPNMRGSDLGGECVRNLGNFEFHMERLRPKLLLFTSVALLDALNSPSCIGAARRVFGWGPRPDVLTRSIEVAGKRHKRFRVGFQKFERVQIIALPHPSGSRGLSDEYIAAFADVIGALLAEYKAERGFLS